MRILLNGFFGKMGKEVLALAKEGYRDSEVVFGVDANMPEGYCDTIPCVTSFDEACADVDCIVDFSHHACTKDLLAFATKNNIPLVIATTGQTDDEKAQISEAAKSIPIFFAANYSLGVALLIDSAKKTALTMREAQIEIIEKHHDRKLDAPSGTALAIAKAINEVRPESHNVLGRSGYGKRTNEEIGIHAIRMGNIVGEHEVIIGTKNQTITLKHEAHSRSLFAEGALVACEFLCSLPKGSQGLYDMNNIISLSDKKETALV